MANRVEALTVLTWLFGALVASGVLITVWSLATGRWAESWTALFLLGYAWIFLGVRRRRAIARAAVDV